MTAKYMRAILPKRRRLRRVRILWESEDGGRKWFLIEVPKNRRKRK